MTTSGPEPARAGQSGGEILVLSGPPGAGKTTVARLLAEELLPPPTVHLHTDDFWAVIRRGAIAPFLPESRRQNETVVGVLARAAAGYAAGGYRVVVDGVVGPWFVDPPPAFGRGDPPSRGGPRRRGGAALRRAAP